METVLNVEFGEKHNALQQESNMGLIWPCDGWCVVCDRPSRIEMRNGLLHHEGGPSVEYRDGFACWSLNGARVEKWLAETPAEQIDPRAFSGINNVEERREFVRKVGIERIVAKSGAEELDSQGDYALLLVDLGGATGKWPYLKMRNPSIDTWHLECVDKSCHTVQEAINFRASALDGVQNWTPEIVT